MFEKPVLGISKCLLGENVRYNGGHQLDKYLRDTLGAYVTYVPVCPEADCGMGIPREALRLVEKDGQIRLITHDSSMDKTDQMQIWMEGVLNQLSKQDLCGFIFKSRSPSSGLFGVKIYKPDGSAAGKGSGIFAKAFTERFPLLPVEEEGRLNDDRLRENFIERVFVMQRLIALEKAPKTPARLMEFHAQHKYLLMAHCPATVKQLGALLGNSKKRSIPIVYKEYACTFIKAFQKLATVHKNTNVLQHLMGYFKQDLTSSEKQELKEVIDHYHSGLVPMIVPIILVQHYVRKYQPEYLMKQWYLSPHPMELMLRNHV